MSEVYDMCRAIKVNNLRFVLNPQDCWTTFNEKFNGNVGEVVDNYDLSAVVKKLYDRMGADKSCSACYKNCHFYTSLL